MLQQEEHVTAKRGHVTLKRGHLTLIRVVTPVVRKISVPTVPRPLVLPLPQATRFYVIHLALRTN